MPPFDPDAYLAAQSQAPATAAPAAASGGFDPDAYLASNPSAIGNSAALVKGPQDKYQQAAIAERDDLIARGIPPREGLTRRIGTGTGFGWGDEINAIMTAPIEAIKRGVNPIEGYRYTKARETLGDRATEANTGIMGDVAEIGGGLATLPGNIFARPLAALLGGATTTKGVLPAVGRTAAKTAAYGTEAGVLGAVQGAGSAETVGDIPKDATRAGITSALIGAPFGAAAKVAPQTTALIPSNAELMRSGVFAQKTRDALPVGYKAEGVGDQLTNLAQSYRQKYAQDTPLTVETLRRKAQNAYDDVAAAKAANIPPGSVKAPGTYSGAPNAGEATLTPRDVAGLRRDIYEEGSGKVSFDASGRRIRNAIPAGSPTDERGATLAGKIMGRTLSHPDPRLLSSGTNMRDAVAASLYDARSRGDFSAAYRSKAVTDAMEEALKSSGNAPFAERLRTSIDKASESGQHSPRTQAELDNLSRMVRSASWANTASELGKKLGAGGNTGMAIAAGAGAGAGYAATQDPTTAFAAALATLGAGRGLRYAGEKGAIAKAEQYAASLRQRSPLYEQRVLMAPMEPGPGLASPLIGLRQVLTTGDQGAIRDAIARIVHKHTTGERDAP